VLSLGTDTLLERTVLPGLAQSQASIWVWMVVTFYRAVYSVAGAWLAAWLAPDYPMGHALTLGVIGLVLSSLGAMIMWGTGPNWYPIALIVIAIPSAWAGGKIATYNP
jgi:hypothetical protein